MLLLVMATAMALIAVAAVLCDPLWPLEVGQIVAASVLP
jgi:hypothetical protein